MFHHAESAAVSLSRRETVAGLAVAPAVLALAQTGTLGPDRLFTFGVASAEPTPDGIAPWTRLGPRPLQGDGGMPGRDVPVRWEVFADEF